MLESSAWHGKILKLRPVSGGMQNKNQSTHKTKDGLTWFVASGPRGRKKKFTNVRFAMSLGSVSFGGMQQSVQSPPHMHTADCWGDSWFAAKKEHIAAHTAQTALHVPERRSSRGPDLLPEPYFPTSSHSKLLKCFKVFVGWASE